MLAAIPKMEAERCDFRPPIRIHHCEKHLLILVLSRLRSGLSTHLCSLSFEGQGTFSTQR
jgi:hypothetical protein